MLLIPPVLLKLASTGYRFARYYTNDPAYRRKGPPPAALRAIAPIVVVSTIVVFASGVALLLIGPSSRSQLLPVHKVSFVAWVAFTALHVLGHLPDLPRALRTRREIGHVTGATDLAPGARAGTAPVAAPVANLPLGSPAARAGRLLSLSGAIVGGVALAIALIPQFSPWLDAQHHLLTGGR
jgi:hypothetical protein